MTLELHLYDFDGTLFRSPDKPERWSGSDWLISPESLDTPCVPETPGAEWWLGRVVEEARQSIRDADLGVYTVLCTGRLLTPEFRERIPELLHQVGLDFDEVLLNPGYPTPTYKTQEVVRILHRYPGIEVVNIWEDSETNIEAVTKAVEAMGKTCVPHLIPREESPEALCVRVAARWLEARRPTPESRAWQSDIKARERHIKDALKAFKQLLKELQPYADQANAAQSGKDKESLQRRGRVFIKMIKELPQVQDYLDTWIGSDTQNPKAYSWRSQVLYQARNRLCYPDRFPLNKVMVEVGKQADKGFEAIAISESQAPLREVVPEDIRAFLPKNIVVEVDDSGVISKVTDRFENEHLTLAKKIQKMHKLVRQYNKIARQVKKDLKNSDELTRMAALITAIIMETGIRPGKEGNHVVKIEDGKEVEIETFGAITLGPKHVKFVRNNFITMEFIGKKGGTNIANLSDASIIKILKDYVEKAKKGGSKFIFTTSKGQQFTYTDLQRYFREQLGDFSPTDFRKLKATETVLNNLRDAQADLYSRIKQFAKVQGDDLRDRVAQEITTTLDEAYRKAQEALSHEDVATTIRSYVNPEIILRFLSQGGVADTLDKAILGGKTKLVFDPKTFVQRAMGKTGSLQDILDDLEDEGVVSS